MFDENKIISKKFECILQDSASDFLHFSYNDGTEITLKNFMCNNFNEDGAILQKLKVHSSLDNFSASAELFQTIPFGSEFEVKRNFDFTDSFARIIVDVNPGIGAIEKLNLEDFEITGNFTDLKLFILKDGKIELKKFDLNSENQIFHDNNELILAFNVSAESGNIFECGSGNDLWRHNSAVNFENCQSRFTLTGNQNRITFSRQILNFSEAEFAPKKRSWRLKYYFAYLDAEKNASNSSFRKVNIQELVGKEFDHVNSFASTPCLAAPLCRRSIRNFLRKANENIELEATLALCDDPAHLERNNSDKILHWAIDDFFELSLWANKQLSKKNYAFRFVLQNDMLADLIAMRSLAKELENSIETE